MYRDKINVENKTSEQDANRLVPINKPIIGEEEKFAVQRVLDSGTLTNPTLDGGEHVRAFEKALCAFTGARNAIAVNSGTAALYCAHLASASNNERCYMPSFTFAATANAAIMAGQKPLFNDVQLEDCLLIRDSDCNVAVPVDLYGHARNWNDEYRSSTIIIEDACQALGSKVSGIHAGLLGTMGCYSFYPAKVMTTGEGGAIVTNNDYLAEQLRMIRNHGQKTQYDSKIVGGNFRMQEINAAIGVEQLKRLPMFLKKRKENWRLFMELLESCANIAVPRLSPVAEVNGYMFTIRVLNGRRDFVKQKLNAAGYGAAVYYPVPLHRMKAFANCERSDLIMENTETLVDTVLSLPCHPEVTDRDVHVMSNIIRLALSA